MHFMTVGISKDLGMTDYSYTVEDEHGNRKTVIARDKYDLGEAIAEGSFYESGVETPAWSSEVTHAPSETSAGGGAGEGLLGIIGGILGFIVFMAILTEVAPRAANVIDTLMSIAFFAFIGWVVFRIVKKFKKA